MSLPQIFGGMMDIDAWIQMMEAKGYEDSAPIVIGSDSPYIYTTTFGDFKAEWTRYRIY